MFPPEFDVSPFLAIHYYISIMGQFVWSHLESGEWAVASVKKDSTRMMLSRNILRYLPVFKEVHQDKQEVVNVSFIN